MQEKNGNGDDTLAESTPTNTARLIAREEGASETLVRVEYKADTAIKDIRAVAAECKAHSKILKSLVDNIAETNIRLDRIEQTLTDIDRGLKTRLHRVEGAQRAGAEAQDRQNEAFRVALNAHTRVVNKSSPPSQPDLAEITKTGVPAISDVVASQLLKRDHDQQRATLAEIHEGKKFWGRQIIMWIVAGTGAVLLAIIGMLIALLLRHI